MLFSCIIILTLRTLPGKPKKQYSDFLEYYPHLLNYFVDWLMDWINVYAVSAILQSCNGGHELFKWTWSLYKKCYERTQNKRSMQTDKQTNKQTNKHSVFTNYIHASILIPLWLIQFMEYIWSMFDLRFR